MFRMSGCERSWSARPQFPILSEHGWLALTAPDFRQAVLDRVTSRKLAAGDPVYRLGDNEGGLWAVIEGGVQFELSGPQLVSSLAHVAIPGFWFGEGPLIGKEARRHDAYASERSVFATISLADCRAILDETPTGWRWIALLASMNRELALGIASDLLLQDPRRRVIATLLRLTGWRDDLSLTPHLGAVQLSQQHLGQIANLSRTVVNATLRGLEARGLIAIGYRSVEVLDGEALKEMLGEH